MKLSMTNFCAQINYFVLFLAAGLILSTPASSQRRSAPRSTGLLSYVDPYIGTGGHGHVFLGASVPFGAVQVGPSNINKGWDWCSGYHYSDSVVKGFAQNHLNGTGIPDLGDILIMPYTGSVRTETGTQANPAEGYSSHYSHSQEVARPNYYSVWLKDHHVKVELTATERVAFHRYTFPSDRPGHIIVDLLQGNFDAGWQHPRVRAHLLKLNDSTLIGWRNSSQWAKDRRIYFAIRTNVPLKDFTLIDGDKPVPQLSLEADTVKGLISFKHMTSNVMLKVGVSNVSGENALANITAEIPGWNFARIVRQGNVKWEKALRKIQVTAPDPVDRTVFYTAFYHTMIAPALYNDHDSSYRGADGKVIANAPFNNYTIFSLWDTYRTLNPLMTLVHPERVSDMVNTMLSIYVQQGKLPIWHLQGRETDCMVGYSAVPVIADAYLKGFGGFDPNLVLEAMKASSTRDDYGVKYLKEEGYIPADKEKESVSKALEYAIDDWCISRVAARLGKKDDEAYYAKRANYFTRYFDTVTKFMRPVLADGSYRAPFDPFQSIHEWGDYTEGNAWQYTWLVPQDVESLVRLMGGDKAFVTKLDSLFVVSKSMGSQASPDISGLIGMYAQGNEPNHHIPYLYAFAGYPWKTAEKITRISREFYTGKNDGLCGNDDAGQMSAWYVMSALGFYPVNPANGIFVFGTPLVREARLEVGNNKQFTMETVNAGAKNIYIQRATLNGVPYRKSYITFQEIKAGSTLRFYMGDKPNPIFGAAPADRPMSNPPAPGIAPAAAAAPGIPAKPISIHINQVVFPASAPKIAVVSTETPLDGAPSFSLVDEADHTRFTGVLSRSQSLPDWGPGKQYYQADFSAFHQPGTYRLRLREDGSAVRPPTTSEKFEIGGPDWARPLIAAILHYYNKQRANTPGELAADRQLRLYGSDRRVDLHGGWCDASGDVSKYFSHLAYANFMSPQQIPLVTWSLINTGETLRSSLEKWGLSDSLTSEALWGADYIMRDLSAEGYFYMTVFSYFKKDPDARRVVGLRANSVTTDEYQSAFREGGGMAIAALARISRWNRNGDFTSQQYLDAARRAYAHLAINNRKYDDDGKENIIDDYCALMAATELWIATSGNSAAGNVTASSTADTGSAADAGVYYRDQARDRATKLVRRLTTSGYFLADDGRRPFWHASDAGLPVIALARYLDKENDPSLRSTVLSGIYTALNYNLRVTAEVSNPFGYARQSFLYHDSVKNGFFIPHDNETGWWWQGENARLASLATAALITRGLPGSGAPSTDSLSLYAARQFSWILGCNPYSMCFMYQFGKNNVPYMSSNYGHGSERGGISNGITGKEGHGDGSGIDFRISANGNEWRWTEQWLPHAAWFLQVLTALADQ
ncbi:MAG TPA: GH92 family glycosyl hydrolase [Puia sp.]|jgi:predicted alpha-1,2-mannosidase|nr:GH92 family glycosyl hydrolase [Puia sp.]